MDVAVSHMKEFRNRMQCFVKWRDSNVTACRWPWCSATHISYPWRL